MHHSFPARRRATRRNHYDVTDLVRISHPAEVLEAIEEILRRRYPSVELAPLRQAMDTFGRLYAGWLPGHLGCDTWYHDAQHSLDCALAMARLIDGHDLASAPEQRLGARRAVLGVIAALFHDSGYVRRAEDSAANGAEFTLSHVQRSGDFLRRYLPELGFAAEAELAGRIVHFTGYEVALDRIEVSDPADRMLGFLLGTADVLAQTADRCYLEKCRDCLYPEFEICGLAGAHRPGRPTPIYASAEDLLLHTPEFNRKLWAERLDGYFGGAHRYLKDHFGGRDPYSECVAENLERISTLIGSGSFAGMNRRVKVIGAAEIRAILGAEPGSLARAA
jgi:hypothetical protein